MIFRLLRKAQMQSLFALMLMFAILSSQAFAQQTAPAALSSIEKDLTASIKIETIKEITAALAADEMQGRGTMQPGGEKAANWIADRFQKFGLKPLGDKGSYLQKIDFKETVLAPETALKIGDETLKIGSDFGILPFTAGNKSASGEMVFVAYGIVVNSIKRNDLGDVNMEGKIAVMLEGPPAAISKKDWEKTKAQQIFIGNIIRKGVAGIIFIGHGREDNPPETMIDYFSRRQLAMAKRKQRFGGNPAGNVCQRERRGKAFCQIRHGSERRARPSRRQRL